MVRLARRITDALSSDEPLTRQVLSRRLEWTLLYLLFLVACIAAIHALGSSDVAAAARAVVPVALALPAAVLANQFQARQQFTREFSELRSATLKTLRETLEYVLRGKVDMIVASLLLSECIGFTSRWEMSGSHRELAKRIATIGQSVHAWTAMSTMPADPVARKVKPTLPPEDLNMPRISAQIAELYSDILKARCP